MLLVLAFLSSCGQMIPILSTDTQLSLGQDQKWSIQYVAVLPGEVSIVAQQYQATLNQMVGQATARGITASWELLPPKSNNDTNLSYQVNFSGKGYDLLNEYIFQNVPVITPASAKDQVDFAFDPTYSLLAKGQYNTFTLKSSKILSANGNRVDDHSVSWVNPATAMTATVSTARDLTWLWISLLAVGGIGFVTAGFGTLRKSAPRRQVTAPAVIVSQAPLPAPARIPVKYCPQCGQENPTEAGFCPYCGTKLSPSQL